MQDVVASLEEAVKYAANETQEKMVREYIEHFRFGDVEKHKDSQR
jgi:dipeptidyl-peptidase-3